jgi:hypothetical protein
MGQAVEGNVPSACCKQQAAATICGGGSGAKWAQGIQHRRDTEPAG